MSNNFIADWLEMPAMQTLPFENLRKNRILLIGGKDSLATVIRKSIDWISDKKNLDMQIDIHDRISEVVAEKNYDYIIEAGLCLVKEKLYLDTVESHFDELFHLASECQVKRVMVLSDYRIFGNEYARQQKSEGEFSIADRILPENRNVMFMQAVESVTIQMSKKYDIPYHILRTSEIYAPGWSLPQSFLHRLAQAVVQKEKIIFYHSHQVYSFCYMGDFLSALWHQWLECPNNKILQVTSTNAVTLEQIMAWFYEYDIDDLNIVFGSQEEFVQQFGNADGEVSLSPAMNCNHFRLFGFVPQMELKKGLKILLKSYCMDIRMGIDPNEYEGKLGTIRDILLYCLLEIDTICKKHDIAYFLAGGTLLGAIRHQGFIPWDDDVDVMMTRDNFERFTSVVKKELPDTLFCQTPETDLFSHYLFLKLRLNDTLFMTSFSVQFPEMHNGIFADVIVQDKTADKPWKQKLHAKITHEIRKMTNNKWKNTPIPRNENVRLKIYQSFREYVKNHVSLKRLEKWRYKALTFYRNKDTGFLYDGAGRNIERGAFPESWLSEAIYVPFEGYMFPVPKEYDKYLTYLYGEYMTMPPVSKREVSHDMQVIDLGKYYRFKLSESRVQKEA